MFFQGLGRRISEHQRKMKSGAVKSRKNPYYMAQAIGEFVAGYLLTKEACEHFFGEGAALEKMQVGAIQYVGEKVEALKGSPALKQALADSVAEATKLVHTGADKLDYAYLLVLGGAAVAFFSAYRNVRNTIG